MPSTEITTVTGLSSLAAMPDQVGADDVLGVILDDVVELEMSGLEAADAVLAVEDAGSGQRVATYRARGDLLGGHRYFCMWVGDTVSAAPTLSKP